MDLKKRSLTADVEKAEPRFLTIWLVYPAVLCARILGFLEVPGN
jgi:hypothetical protein